MWKDSAIVMKMELSVQILQSEWRWNCLYRFCNTNRNGIICKDSAIRIKTIYRFCNYKTQNIFINFLTELDDFQKIDFPFFSNFLGKKDFLVKKKVFWVKIVFWVKKVCWVKKFLGQKTQTQNWKNNWGPLSSTFRVGRPETLTDWKSESVTDLPTDGRTDMGRC